MLGYNMQTHWHEMLMRTPEYQTISICWVFLQNLLRTSNSGHNLYRNWYLCVWVLHPGRVSGRGLIWVGLVVVEVEGLLTAVVVGAPWGTLHHCEAQLHVHLRRSFPLDEPAAQPVAGRAVRLADLIGPHAVVLLIQTTNLFPLREQRTTCGQIKRPRLPPPPPFLK